MGKRLFGTDGIRGVAGERPLDDTTVRRVGAALADDLLASTGHTGRIVLGRDTRESGPRLRDAIARGLASGGAKIVEAGVITTPGLAHVLSSGSFDAGVMISASHNPYRDNGLKVFDRSGSKISDAMESRIAAKVLDEGIADPGDGPSGTEPGPDLVRRYVEHLERSIAPGRLSGLRVVLDCANGAATEIGPAVFRHYGAEVFCVGVEPNGRNINLDCGSLHLERLAETVRSHGYDLGIAFDGDADRALAVDRNGRPVDGDHVLFVTGRRMAREERLPGNAVVATIMSNLWLERALRADGIELHRAPVGDKYVLERMVSENLILGGEQSGHIIFRDHATTGDGVLTGLMLLDALLAEQTTLDAIIDGVEPCPQVQLNVRVGDKPDLRDHPSIGPAVADLERNLGDSGRVVLRYSGTEPVARVMVEGTDAAAVRRQAEDLADVIRRELGVP